MIGIGRTCRTLLALALLLVAAAAQAQAPKSIAAAADLSGSASAARVVEVRGDDIEGARFAAGSDGPVQLLLRDGSTVTLGASSALLIDRFVFDQASRTARLIMTVEAGRFRFVGGRASKDAPVVVNTPTATIEIRGGINLIDVAAGSGDTETIQAFGRDTVATSKSTRERQRLVKNGFTMRIAADQPIATARVDPSRLGTLLATLEGPPGGAGAFEPNARQLRDIASDNSARPPAVYVSAPAADALTGVTTTANRLVASTAQAIAAGISAGTSTGISTGLSGAAPSVLASSTAGVSAGGASGASGSGNISGGAFNSVSGLFFTSGGGGVDTIIVGSCTCDVIPIGSMTTFPLNLPSGTIVFFPKYTGPLPLGTIMISPGVFRVGAH